MELEIVQEEDGTIITHNNKRRLQEQGWEPMRVTFDYSDLENLPSDKTEFKPILIKQAEIIQKFIYKNLLTKRINGNNKFPTSTNRCYTYFVNPKDQTTGIENSDLHIYIGATNHYSQTYMAFANPCVQRSGDNRPVFGLVNYNIGQIKLDKLKENDYFEYLTEISLHEITHILGFSRFLFDSWIDPSTGYPYIKTTLSKANKAGVDETWLITPKVKAYAQKYYNCTEMIGMKLENQGGSGSAGSHWEKVMIENEYMTAATIKHDAIYSNFTFTLLEDSGWYKSTSIDADPAEWGKNQGCSFVTSCSQHKFREFQPQQTEICNFHHNSVSKVSSLQTYGDTCLIPSIVSTRLCIQPSIENWVPESQSGEIYGTESACFKSNIQSTIPEPHSFSTVNWYLQENRCLKHFCDENGNIFIVIVGEKYQIDPETNRIDVQPKGLNKNISGYIEGPEDPYAFCFRYPKPCPNFCNKNGYCMNRQCHCSKNFAGKDCSLECPDDQYIYKNQCLFTQICPQGSKLNSATKECELIILECEENQVKFNNQCLESCPEKTFQNENKECKPCGTHCLSCESPDICTQCVSPYHLHQNKCLDQCPQEYFKNTQTGICEPCHINCLSCSNSYSCNNCKEGFHKPELSDMCELYCFDDCQECETKTQCKICYPYMVKFHDILTDEIKCLETCPEGYYRDDINTCHPCDLSCKSCTIQSHCLSCSTNYVQYNNHDENTIKCLEQCPLGYTPNSQNICEECHIPGCGLCSETQAFHNDECVDECPSKTFMKSGLCLPCHQSCKTCTDEHSCDSCNYGYKIDTDLHLCRQLQCTEGCKKCNLKYEFCYSCQPKMLKLYKGVILTCHGQCPQGYYKSSKVCRKCHKSCESCTSYSACTKCAQNKIEYKNYYLKSGSQLCIDVCPSRTEYDKDSNTCVPCKSTDLFYNGKCTKSCPIGSISYRGICKYKCGYPCQYSKLCGPDFRHIKFGGQYLCYTECPKGTRAYRDRCI